MCAIMRRFEKRDHGRDDATPRGALRLLLEKSRYSPGVKMRMDRNETSGALEKEAVLYCCAIDQLWYSHPPL